jgi:hypothetical protein
MTRRDDIFFRFVQKYVEKAAEASLSYEFFVRAQMQWRGQIHLADRVPLSGIFLKYD